MSNNRDNWKQTVDEFISEAEEDELRLLVSLSDKKGSFSSSDFIDEDESIEPGTWGLAIEKGIVTGSGDKYELKARSEINQHLSGNWNVQSDQSTDQSGEESSDNTANKDLPDVDFDKAKWSRKDKAVAAVGFSGILGFAFEPVRNIIYGLLSVPLNPLLEVLPFFAVVFIIATFTSIWSTFVREKLIDADVSDFREYISVLRDDDGGMFGMPDDVSEDDEQKIMQAQQSMMKAQIKPVGWTMVATIPVIIWVFTTATYGDAGTIVYPLLGEHPWAGTVIGPIRTWIIWYATSSIVLSQIIKRLYDFSGED